uniref:Uncharacterized protein n=1 Tax=Octopus bimaculoides TaxID=37653 RepID=A0A0L8G5V7_OCTBM
MVIKAMKERNGGKAETLLTNSVKMLPKPLFDPMLFIIILEDIIRKFSIECPWTFSKLTICSHCRTYQRAAVKVPSILEM